MEHYIIGIFSFSQKRWCLDRYKRYIKISKYPSKLLPLPSSMIRQVTERSVSHWNHEIGIVSLGQRRMWNDDERFEWTSMIGRTSSPRSMNRIIATIHPRPDSLITLLTIDLKRLAGEQWKWRIAREQPDTRRIIEAWRKSCLKASGWGAKEKYPARIFLFPSFFGITVCFSRIRKVVGKERRDLEKH